MGIPWVKKNFDFVPRGDNAVGHSATNRSETKNELLCLRGPSNPATYGFHSHLSHNQANFSQFQKF